MRRDAIHRNGDEGDEERCNAVLRAMGDLAYLGILKHEVAGSWRRTTTGRSKKRAKRELGTQAQASI